VNRRGQFDWGGSLSHTPLVFSANTIPIRDKSGNQIVGLASVVQRAYITSASGNASYPLGPNRRFESSLGGTRYGFGTNVRTAGFAPDSTIREIENALSGRDPKYLATASAAYVRDFTTNGLTGPLQGGRWRLGITPTVGSQNFVTARADVRRYFYASPFTFAFQALHVGNYGASFNDEFGIGNEYIGEPYRQGFVRGYSVRSIANGIRESDSGCTRVGDAPTISQCAEIDRLFGTRAITTRAELRIPLLGPERLSLIPFRYLPTTLAPFVDAGVTWTGDEGPDFTFERKSDDTTIPVVSTGVAARFNILGALLLEAYYARPFQRRDTTWELGFRISPGF
jgi:outer membrane protein assembly factor BamA